MNKLTYTLLVSGINAAMEDMVSTEVKENDPSSLDGLKYDRYMGYFQSMNGDSGNCNGVVTWEWYDFVNSGAGYEHKIFDGEYKCNPDTFGSVSNSPVDGCYCSPWKKGDDDFTIPRGLDINPDTVSVTGFSSGSAMTMQMHWSYSDTFKGAGLLCGQPYTLGHLYNDINAANDAEITDVEKDAKVQEWAKQAVQNAMDFEKEGEIDSLSNLKDAPVYLNAGTVDMILRPL
jgi:hypothetical protein